MLSGNIFGPETASTRRAAATSDAAAEEVAVAVGAVDAADGRPELMLAQPRRGIRGHLARVGVVPLVGGDAPRGVRCVHRAGCRRRATRPTRRARSRHGSRSCASQKRSSSAFASALGRLDHQRAGHGERHRRRVEAVVDQPLGDVVDTRCRVSRVSGRRSRMHSCATRPLCAGVEHRVMRRQPRAPRSSR